MTVFRQRFLKLIMRRRSLHIYISAPGTRASLSRVETPLNYLLEMKEGSEIDQRNEQRKKNDIG